MASHNELGKEGEELAAKWLSENGYSILHTNWRHSHYEIDIVATKGKFLHFVEVKARKASPFGYPEDSVTKKKFKNLCNYINVSHLFEFSLFLLFYGLIGTHSFMIGPIY